MKKTDKRPERDALTIEKLKKDYPEVYERIKQEQPQLEDISLEEVFKDYLDEP